MILPPHRVPPPRLLKEKEKEKKEKRKKKKKEKEKIRLFFLNG